MANLSLDDLLLYKKKVALKHPKTGKTVKSVWVRLLGDEDLKEAFRFARIASAAKRASLRNEGSDEYKDEILPLRDSDRETWETWIVTSRENVIANEAPVVVPREDLPEIEQIAVQPDAPTLEEQERLDSETEDINKKFTAAVEDYIQTKLAEVKAELEAKSDDEVRDLAVTEYTNIQALQSFLNEVRQQQAYRATYLDEDCKSRGYTSYEAFDRAARDIKLQLIEAYAELEISNEDIKN